MGNQQNKLERQFTSLPAQNFPATSPHNGDQHNNPNFVRKSLRGSRGSKRRLKATMAALRHQNMEVDGCSVPFIDGVFMSQYPLRATIGLQDFEVEGVIAKGAFGNVLRVIGRQDGEIYALKAMKKSKIILEQAVMQCNEEAAIHGATGHHPFIVKPHCFFQNRDNIYIVMEYIPRGELFSAWKHYGHFSEALVQIYIAELAMVIDFLHHNHVIYRDLKMENVLIDAQGHIQLIDFGLAKWLQFGQRTRTVCGTLQYIAPEVLSMEPYGHSADWWSLGIMMFALLTGHYPVRGARDHFEMAEKVMGHEYQLPAASNFTKEARGCVKRLLRQDANNRLCDLYELETDPFFSSLKFDTLLDRQLSPKAHLQRQHSEETYGFIHSRDQSYDGYLGNSLLTAPSAESLDSVEEFGGFDMTRSQSVDGWFTDTQQLRASCHKAGPAAAQISTPNAPPLSRSSSHDQLASTSHPPAQPPTQHRRVTDFYLPPPPSDTPPSSLQSTPVHLGGGGGGGGKSFDEGRLAKMGAKRVPIGIVSPPLQTHGSRISTDTTDFADRMGKTAQTKRIRPMDKPRVEFPQRSNRGQAGGTWLNDGQPGAEKEEQEYLEATRNAAAKIAHRRSKSMDKLASGTSSKRSSVAPEPPPRDPRTLLNKSVDGVDNLPPPVKIRIRPERDRPARREVKSQIQHRKSASHDSTTKQHGSLDNISHCPIRGSMEDMTAPPQAPPTKAIALADLHHHQLEGFIEANQRKTEQPPPPPRETKRSKPETNLDIAAMHKKPILTGAAATNNNKNEPELDIAHRRMESLTGEVTHHVDKVREWLCSTPDVETMERYDFENDISFPTEDNLWYEDEPNDKAKDKMPGSDQNRMQFIEKDQKPRQQSSGNELARPYAKIERSRMHSASGLLESGSVNRPSPPVPPNNQQNLKHVSVSSLHKPPHSSNEKENRPPIISPTPSANIMRKKHVQPQSPEKEDYPPYLSSKLSESTQALFERMSKVNKSTNSPGAAQQNMFVYRYSDSTNLSLAAQRASQVSCSVDSAKLIEDGRSAKPLNVVTNPQERLPISKVDGATYGPGSTQNSLASPVSSYATVIEHSVTSEGATTSNNRHSYVNEKDWAKALENLGLAYPKEKTNAKPDQAKKEDNNSNKQIPQRKPNTMSQSLDLSGQSQYSYSKSSPFHHNHHQTRSVVKESEWHQPKLRSLASHEEHHSASSRSTPNSAQSAPHRLDPHVGGGGGYVNHRQAVQDASVYKVEDYQDEHEGIGYVNVGQQRHSFAADGESRVSTRCFNKVPAKPPRRSPADRGGVIRERVGGKDPIYMEINEARRLLYEGHPPAPSTLASNSMQSFGTAHEPDEAVDSRLRSKSSTVLDEKNIRPKSEYYPKERKERFVRSASVEDNLAEESKPVPCSQNKKRKPYLFNQSPVISSASTPSQFSKLSASKNSENYEGSTPKGIPSQMRHPMSYSSQVRTTLGSPVQMASPKGQSVRVNFSSETRMTPNNHSELMKPVTSEARVGNSSESRVGNSSESRVGNSSESRVGYSSESRVGNSSESRVGNSSESRVASHPVSCSTSRSTTQSPIDNLWNRITARSHLKSGHTEQPPRSGSDSPKTGGHESAASSSTPSPAAGQVSRAIPISPVISAGEPAISRKCQRSVGGATSAAPVTGDGGQSEESSSGYTSMGNSLGSKDGLGSPRLEGNKKSPPAPPIKPKPRTERPKHLDVSVSSHTTNVQSSVQVKSPTVHKGLCASSAKHTDLKQSTNVRNEPQPMMSPRLKQHPTSTSSLHGLLQTDFLDVDVVSSPVTHEPAQTSHDRFLQDSTGSKPQTSLIAHLTPTDPKPVSSFQDRFAQSPTGSHQQSSLATRLTPTRQFASPLSLAPSPSETLVQSSLGIRSPELLSPTGSSASLKPAIARKPLVLTSPQRQLPRPVVKSSTKTDLSTIQSTPKERERPHVHGSATKVQTPPLQKYSPASSSERRHSISDTLDSGYKGSQETRDRGFNTPENSSTPFSDILQRASLLDAATTEYNKRWSVGDNLDQHPYANIPPTPKPETIEDSVKPKNTYVNLDYSRASSKASSRGNSPVKGTPTVIGAAASNTAASNTAASNTAASNTADPNNPYVNLVYHRSKSAVAMSPQPMSPPLPPKASRASSAPHHQDSAPRILDPAHRAPDIAPRTIDPAQRSTDSAHWTSPSTSPIKSRSLSESVPATTSTPGGMGPRSKSVGEPDSVTSPNNRLLTTSYDSSESFAWNNMVADQNASFV